ncbi:MAG: energy transducer TonB [Acidobacteriota bacterium]
MRLITLILSGLLLATQLVAQPTRPVGVQRPYIVERWTRNLEKADSALKAEEWKKALKTAQNVLEEMCGRIEGGEGTAELLGTATFLRAIAEAGRGNTAAANWDYISAQVLVPDLAKQKLSRYGAAGQVLEPWRIDPKTSAAKSLEKLAGVDAERVKDVTPPKKVRAPMPKYPYGKYSACLDGPIKIGFIIDHQGRPIHPRLLTTQEPILGFAALEAVRDWRFEPAQLDGKPVPVTYGLTVNYELDRCKNLFATTQHSKGEGR